MFVTKVFRLVVSLTIAGIAPAQSAKEIVIHRFDGNPFGARLSQVIRDAAGNFYGTAPTGGIYDGGVVYKVDATGKPTVLHNFTGGLDGCTWGHAVRRLRPQGRSVQVGSEWRRDRHVQLYGHSR
jgi:uncharacterized repeat protein (TIGR03803 family)